MTTSITVRVNGNYVREVTIGDGTTPFLVGPGNNIERTFHHGECYNQTVTVGPERAATPEEIAAATPPASTPSTEAPTG